MKPCAISIGLAAVLSLASVARSESLVIDTSSYVAWNFVEAFGVGRDPAYGQTFLAPAGGNVQLDAFSLFMQGPSTLAFKAYVYAWGGEKATGDALFSSDVVSLQGSGLFEEMRFETGGLALNPLDQYVMLASVIGLENESSGVAMWKYQPRGAYRYGDFVYLNSGSNPSDPTSQRWTNDWELTAFRAEFSGENLRLVPEPSSVLLSTLSCVLGFIFWRRSS